jgi:dihydropteroate synthase
VTGGRRRRVGPALAVAAAVLAGAHVVRVHAVREMVQVVRVADEIRKYHRPDS